MIGRRGAFLALLGVLAWSPLAAGATRQIPATRDNTLFDLLADTLSSNGAGPYLFVGDNSQGNTRRALLHFAVAESLPADATIDSVELRLNSSQAQNTSPRTITVHRLLADWGEGTSFSSGGGGARPVPGDATWLHAFYDDRFWTSPGGDFEAAASASIIVTGTGFYSWRGPGLAVDVQAWYDQPGINHGWLLLGDESTVSTARRLDSRESATPANRPVLIIHFTAPDVPVIPVTWGAVKAGIATGLRRND